jgi:large subunit ribosomal protein L24
MKIKKGDQVVMIVGKDRTKRGKVIKVLSKEAKVVVEGLNLLKKHLRPRRSGEKGQIVTISRPVSISNVKLICPHCNQPTRIGYNLDETGKKRRCKKCQQTFN